MADFFKSGRLLTKKNSRLLTKAAEHIAQQPYKVYKRRHSSRKPKTLAVFCIFFANCLVIQKKLSTFALANQK